MDNNNSGNPTTNTSHTSNSSTQDLTSAAPTFIKNDVAILQKPALPHNSKAPLRIDVSSHQSDSGNNINFSGFNPANTSVNASSISSSQLPSESQSQSQFRQPFFPEQHHQNPPRIIPTPPSTTSKTPSSNDSDFSLGEPISLSRSDSISPSALNFDKITQLPTPIINNGSFGFGVGPGPVGAHHLHASSPPSNYQYQQQQLFQEHGIEIPKRTGPSSPLNTNFSLSTSSSSSSSSYRAISDYKPTTTTSLGRKKSLLDHHQLGRDNVSPKRISSNPVQSITSRYQSPSPPVHSNNFPSFGKNINPGSSMAENKPMLTKLDDSQSSTSSSNNNIINPSVKHFPSPPNESPVGDASVSKYNNFIFHTTHSHKSFRFLEEIGSGNFSTVIAAVNVEDEFEKVAIKIISIPTSNKFEIKNFKSFVKRELNILYQINHPSLIHLLDYNINLTIDSKELTDPEATANESEETSPPSDLLVQRSNNQAQNIDATLDTDFNFEVDYHNLQLNNDQMFFLNYCNGGNLFQFSYGHSKSNFDNLNYWRIIQRIVSEIIIGIAYLHHHNIIHRDIKLENVLLNHSFESMINMFENNHPHLQQPLVCITDFGLSKKIPTSDHLLSTRCGSQDYIPPELLMGLKYNGKLTDSWSIGVLIYALLEDRLPFDLPPIDLVSNSGVSPSVIKRRRAKNNPAHRIAMIDWDWFKVSEMSIKAHQSMVANTSSQSSPNLSTPMEAKSLDPRIIEIVSQLKKVTDVLLVRKDRRVSVCNLIEIPEFSWIKACVTENFYSF